jgi:hypothetical protein
MEKNLKTLNILSESSRLFVLSFIALRVRLRLEDGRDRIIFWKRKKTITGYRRSIESLELNQRKKYYIFIL